MKRSHSVPPTLAPKLPPRARTLFVLPDASDPGLTADEALRLELRNRATMTGRCVCGGVARRPRMRRGGIEVVPLVHEHDCPHLSDEAAAAIERRLGRPIEIMAIAVELDLATYGAGGSS